MSQPIRMIRKKFGWTKIWLEKKFGWKKFQVWKKVWQEKYFGWKICWSELILLGKNLWSEKNFGLKIFDWKKIMVQKNFWNEKNFGRKKIVRKKICQKKFWLGKNFGRKFFLVENKMFVGNVLGWKNLNPLLLMPLFCLLDYSSDWVKMILHTKNKLPRFFFLGGGQMTPIFFIYIPFQLGQNKVAC